MTAPYEKVLVYASIADSAQLTNTRLNVLVYASIADSAQPRKTSNVTRPFLILWVGSGDETTLQGALTTLAGSKLVLKHYWQTMCVFQIKDGLTDHNVLRDFKHAWGNGSPKLCLIIVPLVPKYDGCINVKY